MILSEKSASFRAHALAGIDVPHGRLSIGGKQFSSRYRVSLIWKPEVPSVTQTPFAMPSGFSIRCNPLVAITPSRLKAAESRCRF
jgi:hypothetical protein